GKTTQTTTTGELGQAVTPGETGKAGEGYNTTQASEVPTGVPTGSTLTSIIPAAEGKAPVAVWETSPKPTTAIQQSTRAEQLREQLANAFGRLLPRDQVEQLIQQRGTINLETRQ